MYEFNANDVFAFASSISADTHEKNGDELEFKWCPYCNGGNGKDKNTFSINLRTGAYCCLRASCGAKGHFVQLARDFNYPLPDMETKTYRKLPQPKVQILPKPEAIEYLASRGIGEDTAKKYEITVRKDNPSILCFPFFDEAGVLRFIKYRNTKFKKGDKGNKEWCEQETQPILFGMKQCEDFSTLIITEGQLDSLSVAEAGIRNAVSVPTGKQGMSWLTPCYDWVAQFEEVIVFGDHEHGTITLLDDLLKRLPNRVKAVREVDYLGEKDANDILRKYGVNAIRDCIKNAEVPQMENIKRLADAKNIPLESMEHVFTGIDELDRALGIGLAMGDLCIITGKCGEGKSTFMSQIICNVLDQNESIFVYSAELMDSTFKNWLNIQLAGHDHIIATKNCFGEETYSIDEETDKRISDWYRDRLFILDNGYIPPEGQDAEKLEDSIRKVVRQYGTRVVFIDNLMTAMDDVGKGEDVYQAQTQFMDSLKRIAQRYNIIIVIVAHPRKSGSGGFSNDDISGSSNIANKVDVILRYSKHIVKAEEKNTTDDDYDSSVELTKNRHNGKLLAGDDAVKLWYSPDTRRISSIESPIAATKRYGWEAPEHEDWMEEDLPF